MTIVIIFFAIYGLAFALKEADGPFGIMNRFRNALMANKFVGVFFYNMFECWFCTGFHCGWIAYLLAIDNWHLGFFILWAFAGGAISLMVNDIRGYLTRE